MITFEKTHTEQELITQMANQPRLFQFVDDLYRGKEYRLVDLKMMDNNNLSMALYVLIHVFPSESFFQTYNTQMNK